MHGYRDSQHRAHCDQVCTDVSVGDRTVVSTPVVHYIVSCFERSLFAIASGGYFGRGLGNGSPGYIPEVHSDFIFAAVCEEMGVFGGAAIIILFFLIAYRCFKISITAQDPFDKAVSLGLTLMFSVQTFIIVGGVIKMIPLTGITLPFVSYGGTSIVVNFISLGIIQAISKKAEKGQGGGSDESK